MRIPSDLEWDEFHDAEIVDWKRIRSEIEHEDNLTNHRLTWLLMSQGFLFAAFALVFQASTKTDVKEILRPFYEYILAGMATTGILASFLLWLKLKSAELQLDTLREWWKQRLERVENPERHPAICGGPANRLDKRLRGSLFPFVFVLAWVFFIPVVLADFIKANANTIGIVLLVLAVVTGIFCLGWMLGRRSHRPSA